jgi:hypothetical protein
VRDKGCTRRGRFEESAITFDLANTRDVTATFARAPADERSARRAFCRCGRSAESFVAARASEANWLARRDHAAARKEWAEPRFTKQDRYLRFASLSQNRSRNGLADFAILQLQRLQGATCVARQRVVAECIDGIGEDRIGDSMRAHAIVEGREIRDVAPEVSTGGRGIGRAFDAGLDS